MKTFTSKDELKKAYASQVWGNSELWENVNVSYVPHIYKGGYMIRGFGFSNERITETK